jgi:hypothetical protein
LLERFTVLEKGLNVNDIFINIVERSLSGSGGEKNLSVSSRDGVILEWWLVVVSGLNLLNITN